MLSTYPSSAIEQAIALSAVDGIKPSAQGLQILKQVQAGKLSYDQAIAQVLNRAKQYATQTA